MSSKILIAALLGTVIAVPVTESESHTLVTRGDDPPHHIKKGLAYNNGPLTNALSRDNSAVWAYNWGPWRNAPLFQQIPMCRDIGCNKTDLWQNINQKPEDVPYILGYNEPDEITDYGGTDRTVDQVYDGELTAHDDIL
jgi:hypothetical protein